VEAQLVGWLVGTLEETHIGEEVKREPFSSIRVRKDKEGWGLNVKGVQAFKDGVSRRRPVIGTEIDIEHRGQELEEVGKNSYPWKYCRRRAVNLDLFR
jgi:hypothetical protein